MSDYKRYPINTMEDFLAIPQDKLEHCLTHFCSAVRTAVRTVALLKELGEEVAPDHPIRRELRHAVWIDDGKHEITMDVGPEEPSGDQGRDG